MSEAELTWLAEQAAWHKVIVEMGRYLGRSTRALGDNTTGTVYAIDDWYGPRDVEIPEEERTKIFETFVRNMDGLRPKVQPIRCDHGDALPTTEPLMGPPTADGPDMIFIDGDHQYENVKRDIETWWKRLKPGGLLCGHDVQLRGVSEALAETFGDVQIVPNTLIWY